MGYPQHLPRINTTHSDIRPPIWAQEVPLGSYIARGETVPTNSQTPPSSLAQRSYRSNILPRSDSLSHAPERQDSILLKPINQINPSSTAFYVNPKPPPSRRETVTTVIAESPQDNMSMSIPPPVSPEKSLKSTSQPTTNISSFSLPSDASSPSPHTIRRQNSALQQTLYMKMLLGLDQIGKVDNLLIAFFNWIILAGFLIFPATYVSLQKAEDSDSIQNNEVARKAVAAVQHIPLLVMAYICCGVGCVGIVWLWWKLRMNYVWLCNKIFFTICLNSLAGLVSTLINVYGQQKGFWSLQAKITAIATGAVFGIGGILYLLYNFVFLAQVKKRHDQEMAKLEGLA